jgi:chromosome segregation ATPase
MMGSVMDWARLRAEARRQLTDLHRRLAKAQEALTGAQAAAREAETRFDAVCTRVAELERALDEACSEQAKARRERYAARQARGQAAAAVARLERRARQVSGRLERMPPLAAAA